MRKAIQVVAFDARYVNNQYHGIGRHAYNLLEALTRLDTERRYIVYYNPDYQNSRFDLAILGARPHITLHPVRLPLYLPSEQFIWPILLKQAHVDLFHSPYVDLPLLAPVRSIMTIHDLIFEQYPEYRPRSILQRFYQPVTWLGTRHANLVFTVSTAVRREIQTFYKLPASKIKVNGNAVDTRFSRVEDANLLAAVRKRYNLPNRFILTIGAGRPHKNVELLVEAFAHLDPTTTPSLVIAGEHDTRFPDRVHEHIQTHALAQRVIRIGHVREEDLPALYSLADVFVFPSLVEGFGLPPLEAMSCGTPVLASTTPAVAEAVGDAAELFDATSVEQLVVLLQKVLGSAILQKKLSDQGLEHAHSFTWDRVAQATLDAYTSLEDTRTSSFITRRFRTERLNEKDTAAV